MFLKNLKIENENSLIREIKFHKGINLIVDETPSLHKRTESGNSVGKTTVLRLIDFCLDGSDKNIYVDPEFKTHNQKIEKFLKENNIVITLKLVKDLDREDSSSIEIKRNFLARTKKIQLINGEKHSNPEFSKELKQLIFKTSSEKPTFKQLKSKNIRDEKNKLLNTIRVLSSFDTKEAYEALHLFWFGIDIDLSKDKLARDKNLEEKLQKRLRKDSNLPQITQALKIVNKEIDELSEKKQRFNLNEKYEEDLDNLNRIKQELNVLSSDVSRLDLRKSLIEESKSDLEKDISDIDASNVQSMYEKAKILLPDLQRSFEEILSFHNGMIEQKIQFVCQELPELMRDIHEKRNRINHLLQQEKHIANSLEKSGAVEELQDIIDDLNKFHEQKGRLEEQKSAWENSNKNLEDIEKDLKKINSKLYSKNELIQDKIGSFNEIFSDISSRLDGVHSLLSADNENGVYKFSITNIEGNPGTGGKKSQMASFDLSYIKFADDYDVPCLHFVLQDQIENVHSNQITNLLTDIVNEVNCQYVLPVLRDKLPQDIDIDHLQVLTLSQNNKLFKVV